VVFDTQPNSVSITFSDASCVPSGSEVQGSRPGGIDELTGPAAFHVLSAEKLV
jgi:hypothetical protein